MVHALSAYAAVQIWKIAIIILLWLIRRVTKIERFNSLCSMPDYKIINYQLNN